MTLFEVHVYAHNRPQELAARQAIAGVLKKCLADLSFNETRRNTGVISIVLEITKEQYQSILHMPGVQTIRPVH